MGIYEGVSRANDKLDLLSGLVSSKREFIIKQFVNSVLLFVILLIFGCLDFATLKFHGEYLISISYWGQTATRAVAGICAFNIGINILLDNEIKKSAELEKNLSTYNRLIKQKDTDFEYFVTKVFNPKLKVQAYKNWVSRKIYRLNKWSRRKDRLLYSSDLPENQHLKKKNRYCIKRAELEELKSDSYINKNINSLNVRYTEVDPAVFELEINGATKSNKVVVSGNINVGRAKETATVLLSMVLISMLTTSFTLGADKQEFENNMVAFWHYCLKAMEDLGVVCWQFFNGIMRTRKVVSDNLTRPYANRNYVLQEYVNWRHETNAQDSPVFELIKEEEEDDDYIEVDQETANKIKEEMNK